jgi:hypothetical protein
VRYFELRTAFPELFMNGELSKNMAYPKEVDRLDRNFIVSVKEFPSIYWSII